MVCFEELGSKKIQYQNTIADVTIRHQNEMHAEKENVMHKREMAKEGLIQRQNARDLKKMAQEQRLEIRTLRSKHEEKVQTTISRQSANASKNHSRLGSASSSKNPSAYGSAVLGPETKGHSHLPRALAVEEEADEEDEEVATKEGIMSSHSLVALAKRHKEEMSKIDFNQKK